MAKRITLTNTKITCLKDASNEFLNYYTAKGLAQSTLKSRELQYCAVLSDTTGFLS